MDTDLATTQDPVAIYAQMRPDQRTAIAEEFIRLFRLSGDVAAPQFALEPRETLAPEQVAALHTYAREHHLDLFAEVMRHPVTLASLASLAPREKPVAGKGR